MKGIYRGTMSVDELFQALYQDQAFFKEHDITHVRSVSLYFTPCDETGKAKTVRDATGGTVEGYETAGCYHSAADCYDDTGALEPRTVRRTTSSKGKRGGKNGSAGGDGKRCKP